MTAERLAQAERMVARWREPEAQCLLCGRTVEPRKRWAGHQAGCERAILMDLLCEVKRLREGA